MRKTLLCALITVITLVAGGNVPAFTQQSPSTELAGGKGGANFSDAEPQSGSQIIEVRIRSGETVDSVQVVFLLPDGRTIIGTRHGGSGGKLTNFRLDTGEYIIGISGRCGDRIDSLRIHTNKRTSSLFGGKGGDQEYRIDVPMGNQVTGLAGRAGNYIDAIGLFYGPIRRDQAGQTTIAGGRGGSAFADLDVPFGARISEVRVNAGDHVDSIQVIYALTNGSLSEGPRHGGGGGNTGVFRLDTDEYIIGLSGRSGDYIDSLRIHTNKHTSQTFGGQGGRRDFRIEIPTGTRAVGFIGRAADYLDAIGLAYTSLSGNNPSRRNRQQRGFRP